MRSPIADPRVAVHPPLVSAAAQGRLFEVEELGRARALELVSEFERAHPAKPGTSYTGIDWETVPGGETYRADALTGDEERRVLERMLSEVPWVWVGGGDWMLAASIDVALASFGRLFPIQACIFAADAAQEDARLIFVGEYSFPEWFAIRPVALAT